MTTDVLAAILAASGAVVSPVVIQYVKTDSWGKAARTGIPVVVSLAIAGFWIWATGDWDNPSVGWAGKALQVFGIQQFTYNVLLKWWGAQVEAAGKREPGRHAATDE